MILSGTGKGKAILVISQKSDSEADMLEKVCKVLHCRFTQLRGVATGQASQAMA